MRRPRVIIYDDDPLILNMLELFFGMRGYEVRVFSSPVVCPYESLSDRCDKFNRCADLIISDFTMPVMTGVELFRLQAGRGCRLDISMKAIMSGYADEKIALQCKDLGCKLLSKPFTFPELSAWLTGCEKLFDLSQQLNDRTVKRQDFNEEIEFRLNSAVSEKIFPARTFDKNNDGLGLRLLNPLQRGDIIIIVKGPEETHRKGVVKWCSKDGEHTFKAGLCFLNSQ